MKNRVITTLLLLFMCAGVASAAKISLCNNVNMENCTKYRSVEFAARALQDDLNRKFGSPIIDEDATPIEIRFLIDSTIAEFDQYRIEIKKGAIDFVGGDELGLLHSIYSFSHRVLGIDPFIHFTQVMPPLVDKLNVDIQIIKSKPYTFLHRGFFINDEDLITGFQLEKVEYGFNLEFMERVYETALRCQMTGIIPSTLVFSDEPHLRLASDMGLYIMQHHAEPVGSVPLYWSKNEPFSWSTNKDEFIRFWTKAIERQKGRNVIWTLGFRGLLDRDFWDDDPVISKDASDEEKASVINEVIETQYRLIMEITGEKEPLITANMRGEISRLFEKGLIKYPAETIVQFTDNGYGVIYNSSWRSAAKCPYPKGVYQHVSYHSRKSHMRINMVNPDVMYESMERAVDDGLTSLCVLNVGNIKEKVFGIQQAVNYMNDFDSYRNQDDNRYYSWYVKDKYNSTSPALARVYQDFISNHYKLEDEGRALGDENYAYMVEQFLKMIYEREFVKFFIPKTIPKSWRGEVEALSGFDAQMTKIVELHLERLEPAARRWRVSLDRAYDAQSELSGSRLDFYRVDALLPTEKMYHLTSMLCDLYRSVAAYVNKDYHAAQLSAYAAIREIDAVLDVESRIENMHSGDFKDWYRFDQTALTKSSKALLEGYLQHCKDLKFLNLPYQSRNSKTMTIQYKKEPSFDSEYRGELIYMENVE
ncbi:MAG: glycosyl hydrolase 115 family protein [Rikenellaceae bacterium]